MTVEVPYKQVRQEPKQVKYLSGALVYGRLSNSYILTVGVPYWQRDQAK
jgi:hypothetical protein